MTTKRQTATKRQTKKVQSEIVETKQVEAIVTGQIYDMTSPQYLAEMRKGLESIIIPSTLCMTLRDKDNKTILVYAQYQGTDIMSDWVVEFVAKQGNKVTKLNTFTNNNGVITQSANTTPLGVLYDNQTDTQYNNTHDLVIDYCINSAKAIATTDQMFGLLLNLIFTRIAEKGSNMSKSFEPFKLDEFVIAYETIIHTLHSNNVAQSQYIQRIGAFIEAAKQRQLMGV